MAEQVEQLFWVDTTPGLTITLPPSSTEKISCAINSCNFLPVIESQRLEIIRNDSILRKRCLKGIYQENYMDLVNSQHWVDINGEKRLVAPTWRDLLHEKAIQMTDAVVEEMARSKQEVFAVVLFGSVAKNLSRPKPRTHDDDPSNLDLTVIVDFDKVMADCLLDSIKYARCQIGAEIGSNVGVFVQHADALRNGNYSPIINYIGSSARPLYDPHNIWGALETEALAYATVLEDVKKVRCKIREDKRSFLGSKIDIHNVEANLRDWYYKEALDRNIVLLSELEDSVSTSPVYSAERWKKLRDLCTTKFEIRPSKKRSN